MMSFGGDGDGYASWARCGIGSFVVMETTSESPIPGIETLRAAAQDPTTRDQISSLLKKSGMDLSLGVMRAVNQTTSRLVEVTAKGAKVRLEVTATIQGAFFRQETLLVIPANPEPVAEGNQVWTSGTPEEGASVEQISFSSIPAAAPAKESEERLVIAGEGILCRCIEQTGDISGKQLWMKTWRSDQIPGGIARHDARIGVPPEHSSRMIVTSFEKK